MTKELSGRRIVVPETRELGQLVRMLEELGADTLPCPMIAIRDAPDPGPVEAWLRRFADGKSDDLVLMTGEGLRRLLGFAQRINLESAFIDALRLARRLHADQNPSGRCERSDWRPTCPGDHARIVDFRSVNIWKHGIRFRPGPFEEFQKSLIRIARIYN